MKAFSAVLALIGAVLGPGYYSYCEFFSGRSVGTFHTAERLSFDLEPSMNPIAITVNVRHSATTSEFYWATLDSGNQRVAATSFHASADATVASATLDNIRVEQPGSFQLRVGRARDQQNQMLGIELLSPKVGDTA